MKANQARARREEPIPKLLRLDPGLVPGRFRSRADVRRVRPWEAPFTFYRYWKLPPEADFERARQLAITGDPLADDYAVLYPQLGYGRARAMLDRALEHGIDSVADAPPALQALFADVDTPPAWVNWKRITRGGAVMRRYAPFTWLFSRLAFAQTFVNANAGTPLYITGSLGEDTVARRLKETSRWRLELHQPGALERSGTAFKTIVRVRVLHALVRMRLLDHPEWDATALGMPIPQVDMAGANIGMFLVHGLLPRFLGARMSSREYEDVLHLWRYQGRLMGLVDELNPDSHKELLEISKLLELTLRDRHDPRGEQLTRSTMKAHLREGGRVLDRALDALDVRLNHGLYFLVNGHRIFQRMGLRDHKKWALFPAMIFPWVFAADSIRKAVPGGTAFATHIGGRYVNRVLGEEIVKDAAFHPYPAADSRARGSVK